MYFQLLSVSRLLHDIQGFKAAKGRSIYIMMRDMGLPPPSGATRSSRHRGAIDFRACLVLTFFWLLATPAPAFSATDSCLVDTAYVQALLDTGPAPWAWWRLTDGAGSTVARDCTNTPQARQDATYNSTFMSMSLSPRRQKNLPASQAADFFSGTNLTEVTLPVFPAGGPFASSFSLEMCDLPRALLTNTC